jgi:hypothetical protein
MGYLAGTPGFSPTAFDFLEVGNVLVLNAASRSGSPWLLHGPGTRGFQRCRKNPHALGYHDDTENASTTHGIAAAKPKPEMYFQT